ncbi:integrator complex subunit 2 isoform X1 [Hydra vulgaris]|uniref:integrator complex subunit 2 isoform X1 n=1 Tax=Hydra vulgaris TaxID=6087 RepID=UPI001F5E9A9D|nr:integrator complex subunit 2 isoform X1 [Hydra vulgaris]
MECEDLLPTEDTFIALQSGSIKRILNLSNGKIRPILPSLVQLISKPAENVEFECFQKEVIKKLSQIDDVNTVSKLFKIDFGIVHEDAIKEQHLHKKLGSIEMSNDLLGESKGILLEFEESDEIKRIRLVLSEILRVSAQIQENASFKLFDSELFECVTYLEDISDIICVSYAELPSLLTLPELAEVLLRLRFGPELLCILVVNNPHSFDIVCSSILSHASSTEDLNIQTQIRIKTLKMLCHINPQYRKIMRAECVSTRKLIGLAIELSIGENGVENSSDLVPFFTGLLLASDQETKDWLAEYIKVAQKSKIGSNETEDRKNHLEHTKENGLSMLKYQLIEEMEGVINVLIHKDCDDSKLSLKILHGIAIMRFYCALKTVTGFKFSIEESEVLLELITCKPSITAVGVRFVVVGLCTLVACAFLISSPEREDKIVAWLSSLPKQSSLFDDKVGESSYGETLLLIAIHFHNNTFEPVVDLICETLGIKLRPSSLTRVKILFTQQVFSEKVVAEHALTVAITKDLSANIKGFLPVHCVLQLMKSKVFTKHSIPVKDWLFNQLCCCTTPVHPLMLPLIETFVHSIINTVGVGKSSKRQTNSLEEFDEEKILGVFSGFYKCVDITTTQILLMLYCLIYQDSLLGNMKTLVNSRTLKTYSASLYSTIPMKQLLLKACSASYSTLYASLLGLMTTHYPHFNLAEDMLEAEEIAELQVFNHGLPKKMIVSSEEIKKAFVTLNDCPQNVLRLLFHLEMLKPDDLIPYLDVIVEALPLVLNVETPRKVQMVLAGVWKKLNIVAPRMLWLKTVNALHKKPDHIRYEWQKIVPFTDEEIKKDPLIVLRCDEKVYRVPPIFDILLKTLNGYLAASRSLLNHHVLSNPLPTTAMPVSIAADVEREELKSALITAQESAAIQILLEVCLPSEFEEKTLTYSSQSTLREIRCRVCRFIHQSFISTPLMAKLIHFQGYPPSLLEVLCTGVPSMHICIEFIPELLNQAHLEKQLFAVQLISYLAIHYPIPKSYSMCKYTLQRVSDLLMALPVSKRNQFFVPALSCFTRICKAFPPLRNEVVKLLLSIGKIAASQLSKMPLTVVNKSANILDENYTDLDFEMDIDREPIRDNNVNNTNPNRSIDYKLPSNHHFMKACSSQELADETERVFESIMKTNLEEKLALYDT